MKLKINMAPVFLLANLRTLICTLIRTNFLWNHVTSIYALLVNTVQCPDITQGMLRGIYSNRELHLIERAGEFLVAYEGSSTEKSLQIFWYQNIWNIWKEVPSSIVSVWAGEELSATSRHGSIFLPLLLSGESSWLFFFSVCWPILGGSFLSLRYWGTCHVLLCSFKIPRT